MSKIRYYVNIDVLKNLYYALIYPFLTYGVIAYGNTYPTTLKPIYILQKKALQMMTFFKFDEHSSPIFKLLNIIKIFYLVTLHITVFMYKFHHDLLPAAFNNYFIPVNRIYTYSTRSAAKQSYYLPKARTNYGIFNIRFQGPKIWNATEEHIKSPYLTKFKEKLKKIVLRQILVNLNV